MNTKEVVILAGGIGTRIQSISKGLPKCMMQIGSKPFLYHLLLQFIELGADKIILATANKNKYIIKFVIENFKTEVNSGKIVFSNERVQSGTGGAILSAIDKIQSEVFLVSNADTIIPELSNVIWSTLNENMNFLIFLSKMTGSRFSYVNTDETHIIDILGSNETSGKTSSGLVVARKSFITKLNKEPPFSLEIDVLRDEIRHRTVGFKIIGDFIDFGVPEDFARASALYKSKEDSIFR